MKLQGDQLSPGDNRFDEERFVEPTIKLFNH
jgi:hypothetical protein